MDWTRLGTRPSTGVVTVDIEVGHGVHGGSPSSLTIHTVSICISEPDVGAKMSTVCLFGSFKPKPLSLNLGSLLHCVSGPLLDV